MVIPPKGHPALEVTKFNRTDCFCRTDLPLTPSKGSYVSNRIKILKPKTLQKKLNKNKISTGTAQKWCAADSCLGLMDAGDAFREDAH